MNTLTTDQATRERELRYLLARIRRLELRGTREDLELADQLRHQAEEVGRPLSADLVNALLQRYR